MTRDQAKDKINQEIRITSILTKAPHAGYCCPACGSGTGQNGNGTGAVKVYTNTNTWYCHSCNAGGDVLAAIMQTQGLDFNGALEEGCRQLHITIDEKDPHNVNAGAKNTPLPAEGQKDASGTQTGPEGAAESEILPAADYRGYYIKSAAALKQHPEAVAYLTGRGISIATAEKYYIGFDPEADPANAPGGEGRKLHPCPRIILPTTRGHYVGRSIDPNTPKAFEKMNPKNSKPGIFNSAALYGDAETVFVVEGIFDALAIIEGGAEAIALNSTSNADLLIRQLTDKPTRATLIISLDNDQPGQKAVSTLREGLQQLNISFITANICGQNKDPNEALTADRAEFEKDIQKAITQTAARPDNVSSYIDNLMSGEIEQFKAAQNRRTGFANLDEKSGGLYAGLYCIAAISSLGKTTFAHQLADSMAEAGTDVLFFSLEQSRLELVSKSIARRTAEKDRAFGLKNMPNAVTSLSIRRGNLPENVLKCAEEYTAAIGDRLSIIEGNFACNISFIGDYVRNYIKRTGTRPAVFVDYLQILQPADERTQRRDIVDAAITELKRISRAENISVFVISSVNRSNYLTPIDFESLKESGGIEYTADVVWGLQLSCMNEALFDKKEGIAEKRARIREAKAADPRRIQLLCLKNRYGIANFSCEFKYYPKYDLFVPDMTREFDEQTGGKSSRQRR